MDVQRREVVGIERRFPVLLEQRFVQKIGKSVRGREVCREAVLEIAGCRGEDAHRRGVAGGLGRLAHFNQSPFGSGPAALCCRLYIGVYSCGSAGVRPESIAFLKRILAYLAFRVNRLHSCVGWANLRLRRKNVIRNEAHSHTM